jgi:SAM-dependent methyltransferase
VDDHGVAAVTAPLRELLACPRCHARLAWDQDRVACVRPECRFAGRVNDRIVSVLDEGGAAFFDQHFRVMMHGSDEPDAYTAFYAQQVAVLRQELKGAQVILDVGCGPKRVYERPAGSLLLGIDPSYESLQCNEDLDLRLYGSAEALPLPMASVDAIVCLYSLHHFVGSSVWDNEALVRAVFREFARVLRPGGRLLIFEVAPWWPVWAVQRLVWNVARRLAGEIAAMFFWRPAAIRQLAAEYLPSGFSFEYRAFRVPPLTRFAPAFALQNLRIPRALYPFEICMYRWRLPVATAGRPDEARTA